MIMKMCSFEIETFFRVPFDYENEYESIMLELTDEQFNRYCDALRWWEATDEWKNWDIENGDDYFIHRDLPDIWQLLVEFAEFARMKSVLKALKLGKTDKITSKSLGKTDKMHPFNIRKEDKKWLSVR